MEYLLGFLIVYILIIGVIPYLLFKYTSFTLFLTYFANVDMIANILSIHYPKWFKKIYNEEYKTLGEYVSFNAINIVALIGIFIHGIESISHKKSKLQTIISMIIMTIVTWTIPTEALPYMNKKIDEYMETHHKHIEPSLYKKLKLLLTIVASVLFILLEWVLLKYVVE